MRIVGTEFMDKLKFWLEAIPGSNCVRAGAGAYADAILPSACGAGGFGAGAGVGVEVGAAKGNGGGGLTRLLTCSHPVVVP